MRKITAKQKLVLQRNIVRYREQLFPGKGSGNRLAAAVGVSPQLLSQWAKGARFPSFMMLHALAQVFAISIQELCGMPKPASINPKTAALDAIILLTQQQKNIRITKMTRKMRNQGIIAIKSIIDREIGGT